MVKRFKKLLAVLMAFTLLFSNAMPITSQASDDQVSMETQITEEELVIDVESEEEESGEEESEAGQDTESVVTLAELPNETAGNENLPEDGPSLAGEAPEATPTDYVAATSSDYSAAVSKDLPVQADAPTSGTCGTNVSWSIADGVLTLSGTGATSEYTLDGSNVTAPWKNSLDLFDEVVVEDGITQLGSYLFNCCTNIQEVTIPASVVRMETRVFRNCTGLTEITIPGDLTFLGMADFAGSGVTDVYFEGAAPTSVSGTAPFGGLTYTVHYPCNTPSWTSAKFTKLGGTRTLKMEHKDDWDETKGYCSRCRIPVTGVTLDSETANVEIGKTVTLTATVAPETAQYKAVSWSSGDESIATVEDGVVTGVALGEVIITAASDDDNTKTASCTVTVVAAPIAVTGVELNKSQVNMIVSGTEQLTATIAPEDATNKKVTWESDNTDVATVSETGLVTAVAAGTATITVTTENGGKTDTCDVTVVASMGSCGTNIVWSIANDTLILSGTGATNEYTLSDPNNTAPWKNNLNDFSKVEIGEGITQLGSYLFNYCTNITEVSIPASVVRMETRVFRNCTGLTEITIPGNLTFLGMADFAGSGVKDIYFEGEAPASVSGTAPFGGLTYTVHYPCNTPSWTSAKFTKLGGTRTLKMEHKDDWDETKGYCSRCHIPVTEVTLDSETASIEVGGNVTLTAAIVPDTAQYKAVTWASDNENIATVEDGVVTGVAVGEAVITVTSDDDNTKTASCTVTVAAASVHVTGVEINKDETTVVVDKTEQLTATITPEDATNKNVTWASDNETVATVSETGLVTAKKAGSANISVTTEDGSFTDTCAVTVTNPGGSCGTNVTWEIEDGVLTLTGTGATSEYTLSGNNVTAPWRDYLEAFDEVVIGDGITQLGSYLFNCCTNIKKVTIPASVVRMETRVFRNCTGLKSVTIPGNLTFLGMADFAGSGVKDVYFEGAAPASVSGTAPFGGLTYTVHYPCNTPSWTTAKFTSLGGTRTLKMEHKDDWDETKGYCTRCHITVTDLTLDKEEEYVLVGQDLVITATVLPENAQYKTVIWTSDNETAATVTNGTVTGVASGDAIIKAVAADNTELEATCTVHVVTEMVPLQSLALDAGKLDMICGETETLQVIYTPENTTDRKVTWTSDNEEVATVDNGVVTAHKAGTAGIKAVSSDKTKETSCTVNVKNPSGKVGLNVRWELEDGVLTLSGGGKTDEQEFSATEPTSPWKDYVSEIREVVIEDGITQLGSYLFNCHPYIEKVTIPASVYRLETRVFRNCSSLKEIRIPRRLGFLGMGCFVGSGVKDVYMEFASERVSTSATPFGGLTYNLHVRCNDYSWNEEALALMGGTCTIVREHDYDDTGICRNCKLADFDLNENAYTLLANVSKNETLTLKAVDASGKPVAVSFWDSDNDNVATVDGGVVTAHTAGSALITVTGENGSAVCLITVTDIGGTDAGPSTYWLLDEDTGELFIRGSGEISDFTADDLSSQGGNQDELSVSTASAGAPWNAYADQITSIYIDKGVTRVGTNAFSGLKNAKKVTVAAESLDLAENAFTKTIKMAVHYDCDKAQPVIDRNVVTYVKDHVDGAAEAGYCRRCESRIVKYSGEGGSSSVGGAGSRKAGKCGENASWVYNGTTFTLTISGTGAVESYTRNGDVVNYPWKEFKDEIREVVVEEGITTFNNYTFYDFPNLEKVTLPESLKRLEVRVFAKCYKLKSITFNSTLEYLGMEVFVGSGIQEIHFTKSLPFLYSATKPCTGLNYTVYYPCTDGSCDQTDIDSMGGNGTYQQEHLPDYDATSGLCSRCKAAKELKASGTCGENVSWSFANGVLTFSGEGATDSYTRVTGTNIDYPWFEFKYLIRKVVVNDGITGLGTYLCYDLTNLEEVVLPDSLKSIETRTFANCKKLKSISLPQTIEFIGMESFMNSGIADMYFASNAPRVSDTAPMKGCTYTLHIPAGNSMWTDELITKFGGNYTVVRGSSSASGKLGSNAGWSFEGDTLVIEGKGVLPAFVRNPNTDTVDHPWKGYYGKIKHVKVGEGITELGNYTCYRMENVEDVELPETLVNINYASFMGCKSLTSITIPENVEMLGGKTFMQSGLKEIIFEGLAPSRFGKNMFDETAVTALYNCYQSSRDYGPQVTWKKVHEITEVDGIKRCANCHTVAGLTVKGIELGEDAITMKPGDVVELDVKIIPEDATYPGIKWESSEPEVVTVEDGVLTAVNPGSAVITAVAEGGNNVSAKLNVTVLMETAGKKTGETEESGKSGAEEPAESKSWLRSLWETFLSWFR